MNGTLHRVLLDLERRLLDPEVRRNPQAVGALLAPEFREVGKSGRVYDRDAILALLAAESAQTVGIESFQASLLGPEAALATYTSVHGAARAHRCSIWVFQGGGWRMRYHQGTEEDGAR